MRAGARRAPAAGTTPPYAQFHNALAMHRAGRLHEAEAAYRALLERSPDMAEAHSNLGALLTRSGRAQEALDHLRRATSLAPRAQTFKNLGDALAGLGRADDAASAFQSAVRLDPSYAGAFTGLGSALFAEKEFDAALLAFARAVELDPENPQNVMNAAATLGRMGRVADAAPLLERVVRLDPGLAEARYNLALCRRAAGRLDQAVAALDQALRIDPSMIDAEFERAQIRLLAGDFERGWLEYECRWRHPTCDVSRRTFERPLWDGVELPDGTLLLYEEQGYGDAFQFVRFGPAVRQRVGRIVFECRPATRRLFESLPWIDELVTRGDPLPDYDVHAPLMSLPLHLGTRVDSIPADVPYLRPTAADPLVEVPERSTATRVGIVWAGSLHHGVDHQRSACFDDFAPLLQVDGVELVSLQKGPASGQLRSSGADPDGRVAELGSVFADFHDTAGAIAGLDLVVSVDTAVAHLAGAMGKPVWILLAQSPEWRWMRDREDSPWYPTARLFRQSATGDWAGVIERVAAGLREL